MSKETEADDRIAEEYFEAEIDGRPVKLTMQVHRPRFSVQKRCWVCPLIFDSEIERESLDVRGESSMQALMLAVSSAPRAFFSKSPFNWRLWSRAAIHWFPMTYNTFSDAGDDLVSLLLHEQILEQHFVLFENRAETSGKALSCDIAVRAREFRKQRTFRVERIR